ncbi:HAD-IC family P-type ATPase [Bifidobacterium aquikefiri]|uniref:HAD-IC family P-type ATPase n=1 Tax=Bifidobacterium aquikefiri TaxID=1653207 RepID=UPI0023F281B0|nr:HAD-IC family P-type ATPase [Bifidobacterium aquikefiri]
MGFDIFMLGITIVVAGALTWLMLWFFFPKGQMESVPIGEPPDKDSPSSIAMTQRLLIIAALLTIPVFLIIMLPLLSDILVPQWLRSPWIQAILITPVMFYCGRTIHHDGWRGIVHRAPNIDSIVSLGAWAAYLYSLFVCFAPDVLPVGSRDPYFESVGIIITLVLLGKLLEDKVRAGSGEAVSALQRLYPQNSHKVSAQVASSLKTGNHTNDNLNLDAIPIEDAETSTLRSGDVVLVGAGERIPADGLVVGGSARIDDSSITGNSQSIHIEYGRKVCATSLVVQGSILVQVTAIATNSVLGHIIALVSKARSTSAPLQTLALRLSRIIVTAVIILAIWTFAIWIVVGPQPRLSHALVTGISVLIVACPCALALATPLSAFVAMNLGATQGILMSSGLSLSRARSITKIFFEADMLSTHDTRNPKETSAALHKAGISIGMFTHDTSADTMRQASEFGVDEIIPLAVPNDANMQSDIQHKPQPSLHERNVEMAQWIRHFVDQNSGSGLVAMVGDSEKDTLAFDEADVAFALGTASNQAMQSADITILSGDMQGVLHAISLSRQTIGNMRENLVWALIYNVVGIPFAMGILYPFTGWLLTPAIAGLAMTCSLLCVIINAHRLSKTDIKHTWEYVESDIVHRTPHIVTQI